MLVGSISTFAMPKPPEGWLICDGQEVSRQTYALLFSRIGTSFGEGDGEETFTLPDLRDVFVRGWDGEREFGSHQEDQMQGHSHRDGGHSHKGSTENAGSHEHSGKSGMGGSHSHSGNTSENGRHWHYLDKRGDDSFRATGYFELGSNSPNSHGRIPASGTNGSSWNGYPSYITSTDPDGSHTHSLSTNSAGSHYHLLEINSAGSHSHVLTTASASANLGWPSAISHGDPRFGTETRPVNVTLLFCIKY
ncbi:MAG: tail fiber protein [Candidatus Electrothrix sp. MAN1_4]|nr:tail fiber protein [Candidatus Electrothrix sp. MAN1_4]